MAAIVIMAGLAIADKVDKKKEQKRQKQLNDDQRYRDLQVETDRRLKRTQSGNVITEEGNEEDEEDEAPPSYDYIVGVRRDTGAGTSSRDTKRTERPKSWWRPGSRSNASKSVA